MAIAEIERILFLDIDGVLNRCVPEQFGILDPSKIKFINKIVSETNCEVVLTSQWRTFYDMGELQAKFSKCGLERALLDTVPLVEHPIDSSIELGMCIGAYLNAHPDITQFVILDDCRDVEPFVNNCVVTDPWVGMTAQNMEDAISMLLSDNP